MQENEKLSFLSMLDTLADMLHVDRIASGYKELYFENLKRFPSDRCVAAIKLLQENYKPRWKSDFPVLREFTSAINSLPLPDHQIFHSYPCRCCDVRPFDNGKLACKCDMERCFKCYKCGVCCRCENGPIPLMELSEWKELYAQLNQVSAKPNA